MKVIKMLSLRVTLRLCASLILLPGCAGHHTSSRTAELLDDKVISDRVEAALHRASARSFERVQVNTAGAVVTLRGSVPNLESKARAARIARGVEYVRDVHDRLQVRNLGGQGGS